MMAQELYVVCTAKRKDGTSVKFESDPFVLTGNRDKKRKRDVIEIQKAPDVPSVIQNPPVLHEANDSAVIINTLPTSSTVQSPSRTDRSQLTMQFQETAHPNQENPPQPSELTDSPFDLISDDFPDFTSGRFAN